MFDPGRYRGRNVSGFKSESCWLVPHHTFQGKTTRLSGMRVLIY